MLLQGVPLIVNFAERRMRLLQCKRAGKVEQSLLPGQRRCAHRATLTGGSRRRFHEKLALSHRPLTDEQSIDSRSRHMNPHRNKVVRTCSQEEEALPITVHRAGPSLRQVISLSTFFHVQLCVRVNVHVCNEQDHVCVPAHLCTF